MKMENRTEKQLADLKSKHIDKFHYHRNKKEAHKMYINEINEEQVNRLLMKFRKCKRGKKKQ